MILSSLRRCSERDLQRKFIVGKNLWVCQELKQDAYRGGGVAGKARIGLEKELGPIRNFAQKKLSSKRTFMCTPKMTQSQALVHPQNRCKCFSCLVNVRVVALTYVVNAYVAYLRAHGIEPAITASTGIAATHIGGMTIHSWSGIGIKTKLDARELKYITAHPYVTRQCWPRERAHQEKSIL